MGLLVALSDPALENAARNVWHEYDPEIVIASANTLQSVYRRYFVDSASEFDASLDEFHRAVATEGGEDRAMEKTPFLMQNIYGQLIRHACYAGASDIHMHKSERAGVIKLRINGKLTIFRSIPSKMFDMVMNKLVTENTKVEDLRREPQECTINFKGDEVHKKFADIISRYRFRMELTETKGDRKAVIRLLDKQSQEAQFDRLNFDVHTADTLKRIVNSSTGLIIVTGPTGSGKTTTLYALLKLIDPVERSVQTIENPIEYRHGLWMQNEIPKQADEGEGARLLLKASLRNDPDVILFGEVRDDAMVAKMLLAAANTGHLVFTTMHTNDSTAVIPRLRDIGGEGVNMESLASVLKVVLAQRLVRVLCQYCKTPDKTPETMMKLNGAPYLEGLEMTPFKACGCPNCNHTGYRTRRMVYEIMDANEVRDMIEAGAPVSAIRKKAIKPGKGLWANGLKLVAQGVTSLDELMSVVDQED